MSYTKTNWVNNQTKLNADNMNHIEGGIDNSYTKAVEAINKALNAENKADNVADALTDVVQRIIPLEASVEALEGSTGGLAADLDEVSLTADAALEGVTEIRPQIAQKQDKLISGANIKTVNGFSILGSGNIEIEEGQSVDYDELDNVSLDDILTNGIYKITSAKKCPVGTATSGILQVTVLDNLNAQQEWISDTKRAIRITGTPTIPDFYVNGELVRPVAGKIKLDSGNEYTLAGDLNGCVVIGEESDTPTSKTKIRLAGVNILSEEDCGIIYSPADKSLCVELVGDYENYIVVNNSETTETSSTGAIHSNNTMTLTGTGYLGIKNNIGHGFKASKLNIAGDPTVVIDVHHDGIHGSNTFTMSGGDISILNANDAIGYSDSATSNVLYISGGHINIVNCVQNAIDCPVAAGKKWIFGTTNIKLTKKFTTYPAFPTGINIYSPVVIDNVGGSGVIPELKDLAEEYGDPTLTISGATTEIEPDEFGVYRISETTGATSFKMSGNFTGKKIEIEVPAGDTGKIDIECDGVYYDDTEEETSAEDTPFIKHISGEKRLKLKQPTEGTLTYIRKKHGTCIETNKNIQVTSKGDFVAIADDGVAVDASTGYTLLSGDGLRYLSGSTCGIKTNNLKLGEDPDDIIKSVSDRAASGCNIYIKGLTITDSIKSATATYKYPRQIIATQYHTGTSVIYDDISYSGSAAEKLLVTIYALSGDVELSGKDVYTNTAMLNINENDFTMNDNVVTFTKSQFDPDFPEDSSETTGVGTWSVQDVYTTTESRNKFVAKTDYEETVQKCDELEAACERLEIENEKQRKSINLLEDRFASVLFATYPKITYTATSLSPIVVRGNEGLVSDEIWTNGSETYSYNKDGSGYEPAGDNAQFNVVVTCPEGKLPSATITYPEGSVVPYNKLEITQYMEDGVAVENKYRVKVTKVTGSFSIVIEARATYDVTYVEGTNKFSVGDCPAEVAEGSDLIFKFLQKPDGSKESGATVESTLAKIDSIKIGEVNIQLTDSLVSNAGSSKATIRVPSSSIDGSIVITLK